MRYSNLAFVLTDIAFYVIFTCFVMIILNKSSATGKHIFIKNTLWVLFVIILILSIIISVIGCMLIEASSPGRLSCF